MVKIIEQLKYNSFIVYDKYVHMIVLPVSLGNDNLITDKYEDFVTFNYNSFHTLANGVRANNILQQLKSFVAKKKLLNEVCDKEVMKEYLLSRVKDGVNYICSEFGIKTYFSIFDDFIDEKYNPVDINCKSLLYACNNENVLRTLYLLCNNNKKVETVYYIKLKNILEELVKDHIGQITGYAVTIKGSDVRFYGFVGEEGIVLTFSLESLNLMGSIINIVNKINKINYGYSNLILSDGEKLLDIR